MSDRHEESRAAFEAALHCENVQRLAPHMRLYQHPFTQWRWEGWKLALDHAASRECVWTGFSTHGRTHYRTCRGVLNYTEMPRLQFIPYCPACGGRVKIEQQTDEEQ